jgi:putative ATP-dependent endonuclease of OLD family
LAELGTGEQQILALSFAYAYATAFHRGIVLIVEEPEAHLHPLAQQWLARHMHTLASDGLQIVITTHSPHFINVESLEGLAYVRRSATGTSVVQVDKAALVEHCLATGAPADKVTEEGILPYYSANMTPQILEGFFAKVVVLVEGPTETLALPIYLEECGITPARDGVAIVPVGGKGNLGKWRRLFSAYGIPTFVVFDNDGRQDDRQGNKRRDALRSLGIGEDRENDYLFETGWRVWPELMVFGRNFEQELREHFPSYADLVSCNSELRHKSG